jgi:hypothetical protein
MLDPAELERTAYSLLAMAAELRAATPTEDAEPPESDAWLTEREAAELISALSGRRCDPERLRKHRRERSGPPAEHYGRNGRFVRYRKSAVLAWQAANPGRKSGHSGIDDDYGEA